MGLNPLQDLKSKENDHKERGRGGTPSRKSIRMHTNMEVFTIICKMLAWFVAETLERVPVMQRLVFRLNIFHVLVRTNVEFSLKLSPFIMYWCVFTYSNGHCFPSLTKSQILKWNHRVWLSSWQRLILKYCLSWPDCWKVIGHVWARQTCAIAKLFSFRQIPRQDFLLISSFNLSTYNIHWRW